MAFLVDNPFTNATDQIHKMILILDGSARDRITTGLELWFASAIVRTRYNNVTILQVVIGDAIFCVT